MKVQITRVWRAEERRKYSKTRIKEKEAPEMNLKAQNCRARPPEGREAAAGLASRSRTGHRDRRQALNHPQAQRGTVLGPAHGHHVERQTQHHRPLGFQKKMEIRLLPCSHPVCELPKPSPKSAAPLWPRAPGPPARSRQTGRRQCPGVSAQQPAGQVQVTAGPDHLPSPSDHRHRPSQHACFTDGESEAWEEPVTFS